MSMTSKPVYVINNLESVVEVFLDEKKEAVIEKKRLNYNRYKTYSYELKDYMERNKHKAVYTHLLNALN